MRLLLPSLLITLALPSLLLASVQKRGEALVISGARYAVSFSAADGSIVSNPRKPQGADEIIELFEKII